MPELSRNMRRGRASNQGAQGAGVTVRQRLAAELEPRAVRGLSGLNLVLAILIVASVAAAVLETEPTVSRGREALFRTLEIGFAFVFAVEYLARVWTAAERGGWRARLRWLLSPAAILDLLAVLPVLAIAGLGPFYLLRLLRLARILRLAKLGRLSSAWSLLAGVVGSRRFELMLSFLAAMVVVLFSATLMFMVEGEVQPAKFGSIPRSMWWSVVTLTTIGYGDVYPITPPGRLVAAVTALLGIGLIAAPTGILAAALSEALAERRRTGAAERT